MDPLPDAQVLTEQLPGWLSYYSEGEARGTVNHDLAYHSFRTGLDKRRLDPRPGCGRPPLHALSAEQIVRKEHCIVFDVTAMIGRSNRMCSFDGERAYR